MSKPLVIILLLHKAVSPTTNTTTMSNNVYFIVMSNVAVRSHAPAAAAVAEGESTSFGVKWSVVDYCKRVRLSLPSHGCHC